jgi:hypothetical protein
LTVSTVAGDTFVQLGEFIATDNVLVCKPKRSFRITTLFFLALMLNYQKWRYFYGRQCYINKFLRVNLQLPISEPTVIDEDVIETIVKQTTYWNEVERYFTKQ